MSQRFTKEQGILLQDCADLLLAALKEIAPEDFAKESDLPGFDPLAVVVGMCAKKMGLVSVVCATAPGSEAAGRFNTSTREDADSWSDPDVLAMATGLLGEAVTALGASRPTRAEFFRTLLIATDGKGSPL